MPYYNVVRFSKVSDLYINYYANIRLAKCIFE